MSKSILRQVNSQIGSNTIFSKTKMETFVDVFVGGGSVTMAVMNEYSISFFPND